MNRQTTLKNEKNLLTSLAVQELRHKRLLQEILNTENFSDAKKKVDSEHINKDDIITNFDLNETTAYVKDTFEIAIENETNDYTIYVELLKSTKSEELKKLFSFLAEEENNHKILLQKEYSRM